MILFSTTAVQAGTVVVATTNALGQNIIPFGNNIMVMFHFDNTGDPLSEGRYVVAVPTGLAVNINETVALMADDMKLTIWPSDVHFLANYQPLNS